MSVRLWPTAMLFLSLAACSNHAAERLPAAPPSRWTPAAWRHLGTLEFLTVGPEEGAHWSTVWLVVIDGQVYVRLGRRASGRVARNTAKSYLQVRIAGLRFRRVRAEPAPEMVKRVSEAMAKKYWLDFTVGWLPHPMTLRLVPEKAP